MVRLLKVCLAFPFVIVVSSLNLSNQYTFLRFSSIIDHCRLSLIIFLCRSVTGMRIMNILVYVAPVVYGR